MLQIKFYKFFSTFLYIIPLLVSLAECRTEWIDPFSMDDDPTIKTQCDCSTTNSLPSSSQSIIASHYVRTISLLLNSLRYDKSFNIQRAHYDVNLQQDEYDFIRSFLSGAMDDGKDWDKMDRLFTSMFKNTEDTYFMSFLTWKDYLFHMFSLQEIGIVTGTIFLIWFSYKAMHAKITMLSVVKYLAFCMYLIDYVYTWIYMLKEKELEQLLHVTNTVPPECDVKKMGWSQYLSYISHTFMGKDKCKEYHKIKDIDIFWSVSPSQVFGSQIGNMILAPSEKIGNAFGKLTSAVMDQSSWYLMLPTLLMLPILLFGLLLAGCVFLSFVTGRCFSFNLFHIFQFSFGKNAETTPSNESTKPQQINLVMPNMVQALGQSPKKKRIRAREEKKTPILSQVPSNTTAPRQAIKQEVEEVEESSSNEDIEDLKVESAVDIAKKRCDDSEYEVIG